MTAALTERREGDSVTDQPNDDERPQEKRLRHPPQHFRIIRDRRPARRVLDQIRAGEVVG